jgi:hypothetical protein
MKLCYIGTSGRLNTVLIEKLKSLNLPFELVCEPARDPSYLNIEECSSVIYGGRLLSHETFLFLKSKKMSIIYISTFVPNEFFDLYQFGKQLDEQKAEVLDGNILRIPFISEFLPKKLESILTDEDSDYSVAITSIKNIISSLDALVKGEQGALGMTHKSIDYGLNDKVIWMFFSRLYNVSRIIKNLFFKKKFLLFVKVLEKIIHFIFRGSGISAVFVTKSGV